MARYIDIEPFETERNLTSCSIQRFHNGPDGCDVISTPTKDIPTVDIESLETVHRVRVRELTAELEAAKAELSRFHTIKKFMEALTGKEIDI